jgi:hypothetical protein
MLPARPTRQIRRNVGIPASPVGDQELSEKHNQNRNWLKGYKSTPILTEKVGTDRFGSQFTMMAPPVKLSKPRNLHMLALPPLSAQHKSSHGKLNFIELNKRLLANRSASLQKSLTKSCPLNEDISVILK